MSFSSPKHLLAQRLLLPPGTKAMLWDMDGVLIDSLGLDMKVCNQLIENQFGSGMQLPDEFIRSIFAFHPPAFWRRIFAYLQENYQLNCDSAIQSAMLEAYEACRLGTAFDLLPGIKEILAEARVMELSLGVVSNNLTRDVHTILERAGILDSFELIVGNDLEGYQKKPAPDCYLYAARQLQVAPEQCVVIEDSLLGLEAGFRAGCHTVAVTTGGTRFDTLVG